MLSVALRTDIHLVTKKEPVRREVACGAMYGVGRVYVQSGGPCTLGGRAARSADRAAGNYFKILYYAA